MADEKYVLRADCDELAVEDLIDNMPNMRHERQELARADTRFGFASIAGDIARDRYSAGSSAAMVAIIVMLKFGQEAAINFARDVNHHEE